VSDWFQVTQQLVDSFAELTLDPELQPRANGLIETAWRTYAEGMSRGDAFPPIRVVVGRDEHGTVHRWLTQGCRQRTPGGR